MILGAKGYFSKMSCAILIKNTSENII